MVSEKENLSNEIYTTLKDQIIKWEYHPNFRLTEESLCTKFGVSRSPIREALWMLVENGLVNKEPHKGYRVIQPNLDEIHELYDVRLALELFVVEWLAEKGMPSSKWEKLYNSWQATREELPQKITDFATKDEEFHKTLAACTMNQTLIKHLQTVAERLHFIRMTDITTTERLRRTCEQHLSILNSIKTRDVDRARKALRINIEYGRINVEEAVKEVLAWAYLDRKSYA